jgi:hypothetical protein
MAVETVCKSSHQKASAHWLRRVTLLVAMLVLTALAAAFAAPRVQLSGAARSYLGCDLNQYPGDDAMRQLRQDCRFVGYWLGPPPGEKVGSWQGHHELLRKLGFGFLPLSLGPDSAQLKSMKGASQQGAIDGKSAAEAAMREGFLLGTIVYLDVEEGGRLSPNYHAYLRSWTAALRQGGFRPGVYCSGMPVDEGQGVVITTAADIHNDPAALDISFWVYNDQCPPSHGCEPVSSPPVPSASGVPFAAVWQFAQSPRRRQYTSRCPLKYAPDGNCYAPSDTAHKWFLDLNSALSPDPSIAGL